ncbi:hypothetical protein [Pseudooceanicola marinus]|uniref:hypothetical protein n=1 Tax=Pseudooceanicola marinus TaxID=396013 RepID=UPI001CD51CE4|nr:hypothetical protein [Pseudooceanicola marinus]MCA1336326.1 hypothetical protein [Pseudooceanicola marinus]
MRPAIGRIFLALWLTLLLAWGSVLSAAHMTPTADDIARERSVLVLEAGYDSLCAEEGGAGHHCPFCHALPKAAAPQAPEAPARLILALAHAPAAHLISGARPGQRHAPRAPPAPIL